MAIESAGLRQTLGFPLGRSCRKCVRRRTAIRRMRRSGRVQEGEVKGSSGERTLTRRIQRAWKGNHEEEEEEEEEEKRQEVREGEKKRRKAVEGADGTSAIQRGEEEGDEEEKGADTLIMREASGRKRRGPSSLILKERTGKSSSFIPSRR